MALRSSGRLATSRQFRLDIPEARSPHEDALMIVIDHCTGEEHEAIRTVSVRKGEEGQKRGKGGTGLGLCHEHRPPSQSFFMRWYLSITERSSSFQITCIKSAAGSQSAPNRRHAARRTNAKRQTCDALKRKIQRICSRRFVDEIPKREERQMYRLWKHLGSTCMLRRVWKLMTMSKERGGDDVRAEACSRRRRRRGRRRV